MKPNELRLGNYVRYHHNGGFVEAPIFHLTDEDVNVLPIELTPEILLKAGFKKEEWWERYEYTLDIDGCYGFKYENDVFTFTCEDMHYNKDLSYIKYLHQLQNLYFALTGEELEVKL